MKITLLNCMVGIVDVGGGLRGIYGAGVFDRLLDDDITLDYCIGVSAGSANIASYTAGQKGRNYKFYTEYIFHRDYMSFKNIIKKGAYLDLGYIYGTLSNNGGENPLDFEKMSSYCGQIKIVATDAQSGETVYLDKADIKQDNYWPFIASSSLPIACKPYCSGESTYFDGGISDPVPIRKAFSDGCDKVIVILTKPIEPLIKNTRDILGAKLLNKKYPNFAKKLREHNDIYNESVEFALECQEKGDALVICPSSDLNMGTLTKDIQKLDTLYKMGYDDAEKIKQFMQPRV